MQCSFHWPCARFRRHWKIKSVSSSTNRSWETGRLAIISWQLHGKINSKITDRSWCAPSIIKLQKMHFGWQVWGMLGIAHFGVANGCKRLFSCFWLFGWEHVNFLVKFYMEVDVSGCFGWGHVTVLVKFYMVKFHREVDVSRCFGRGRVIFLVKFYMEVDVSGWGMLSFWWSSTWK